MSNVLTLGSLFSGSGGFELAGLTVGMKPLWASEVEPFPIRVTSKRLPFVAHMGDVRNLDGANLPPVDIITFGSPCQDLSIAGKRSGIEGSRSSLFYEAIRIIKEMRWKTNGNYPKYALWENVPGAFSSHKGADFEKVLEAFLSVKGYTLDAPRPQKWHSVGEIVADHFSLSWRVLDAQHFGVPQRRKRIFLVADFGDTRAGKILFESESVLGDLEACQDERKRPAGNPKRGAYETGRLVLNDQGGSRMDISEDVTGTLRAQSNHPPLIFENHGQDARYTGPNDTAQTIVSRFGTGGNNQPLVVDLPCAYSLCSKKNKAMFSDIKDNSQITETSRTLDTRGSDPVCNQGGMAVLSYGLDRASFNQGQNAAYDFAVEKECQPTMVAKGPGAVATENESGYIVRRLTPTECARLQGFPDGWCDGLAEENPSKAQFTFWREIFDRYTDMMSIQRKSDKQIKKWLKNPYSDSAAYKLWGNGIALPCAIFVLAAIKKNSGIYLQK